MHSSTIRAIDGNRREALAAAVNVYPPAPALTAGPSMPNLHNSRTALDKMFRTRGKVQDALLNVQAALERIRRNILIRHHEIVSTSLSGTC